MYSEIPLSGADITEQEIGAVIAVLRSKRLALGPKLTEFESQMSSYTGRQYAVAVNSGTSALHLLIRAFGIKSGDEVITTPFSFIASANCILFEGATPVFVDIDEETFNLNPALVEKALTPKTKAILPVHLFGQPVHLSKIATYSIGFFGFWGVCAASSLLTCFLQRSAAEVNKGVGAAPSSEEGCGK